MARRTKEVIERELADATAKLTEAKAALKAFDESAKGRKFREATEKRKALDAEHDAARANEFKVWDRAARRLGIYHSVKDSDGTKSREITDAFEAAFAETVGLTRKESAAMSGLNSLGGNRYDGAELYWHALQRTAKALVDADDEVKAAAAGERAAYHALQKFDREVFDPLEEERRNIERVVVSNEHYIERRKSELADREEQAQSRSVKSVPDPEARALAEKAEAAKPKVLAVLRQYAYPNSDAARTWRGSKDPLPEHGLKMKWPK